MHGFKTAGGLTALDGLQPATHAPETYEVMVSIAEDAASSPPAKGADVTNKLMKC